MFPIRFILLPFALLAACAVTPRVDLATTSPHGPVPSIDWEKAGDETVRSLQEYVRIPTINPPGNEAAGVAYLKEILDKEGIETEVVEHAPGRPSLIARLRGNGSQQALCLMSHVDVVTADDAKWPADAQPFSGVIKDGELWGRGTLDMKGIGILELQTLLLLKRSGVKLSRDVVLLAVADEEMGNDGATFLANEHLARLGCSHLVNEGGMGIRDAIFEGQTLYGISNAEKGVLWLKMIAEGPGGHGSTYFPGRAPEKLVKALEKLRARKPKPFVVPAMYQALGEVGAHKGGVLGFVLARPALVDSVAMGRLLGSPQGSALVTNTAQVTGFGGAKAPNVVPGEVFAQLDCRLLPGTTAEMMIAELQAVVEDPSIRFDVLQAYPAFESPVDDPLFRALARWSVEGLTDAVAAPALSPGFTDSMFFRAKGVRAYGLAPFRLTVEEAGRMHGEGERVSIAELKRGLRALFMAVAEVSIAP